MMSAEEIAERARQLSGGRTGGVRLADGRVTLALDATGALLAESSVRVGAATESILTVQRGLERESYSCTPACQPSAQLGDGKTFFESTNGQSGARNAAATGGEKK